MSGHSNIAYVRVGKALESSTHDQTAERVVTHERRWLLVDPLRQDLKHARRDVSAREGQPLQQEPSRLVDPHLVRAPVLQPVVDEVSALMFVS